MARADGRCIAVLGLRCTQGGGLDARRSSEGVLGISAANENDHSVRVVAIGSGVYRLDASDAATTIARVFFAVNSTDAQAINGRAN